MDLIKVSNEIKKCIDELELAKRHLAKRGEVKAETSAAYDKAVALTMIKIRNGRALKLDDEVLSDVPATAYDKVARGICWEQKLEMEKAEAEYKSLITYISTVESQLNGWQSINKYLAEK